MRWLGAALAVAGILAISGCAASESGGVASDAPLDVYLSVPLSGPRAEAGKQIAASAEEALAGAGGKAGEHPIELKVLDSTGGDGTIDPVAVAANARQASEDADTIAYLGELEAGASETSLLITDRAEIPQVLLGESPTGLDVDNRVLLPDDPRRAPAATGNAAMKLVLTAVAGAGKQAGDRAEVRNRMRDVAGPG